MKFISPLIVGACVLLPLAQVAAQAPAQHLMLAQADVRPLVSGERVRVKKIARDIDSATQQMDQGGVMPFQNPAYVKKWQDSVARHRKALQKYPQLDDPDVRAAHAKLANMERLLAVGIEQAGAQNAQLGDVQAQLAQLEAALRANRPPKALQTPFSEAQAKAWVATASKSQQVATEAISKIQHLAANAHLPNNPGTVQSGAPYDRNDLNRLLNFAQRGQKSLQAAMQQTKDNLVHQLRMQHQSLDYFRGLDPQNEQHRMNAFLREGADVEIYQRLDRELALAKSAAAWQAALNTPLSDDVRARIEEIKSLRARYAEQRLAALGASKLPPAKGTDSSLLKIAEQILAKPKYKFGEHGPIVLTTAAVVDREKKFSQQEYNDVEISLNGDITLSGTETTWTYRWQEFKFATPIRDAASGQWHVWWITARKFSSGSAKTPIGEWVSGRATQGDLILAENF